MDARTVVEGRVESVWPVHGSVLVLGDVCYFALGRSSYLDGGIRLYGLDVFTGKKLHEATVSSLPRHRGISDQETGTGALPDVLVSDGTWINMRQVQFDRQLVQRDVASLKTLFSVTGLLEDDIKRAITLLTELRLVAPSDIADSAQRVIYSAFAQEITSALSSEKLSAATDVFNASINDFVNRVRHYMHVEDHDFQVLDRRALDTLLD